MLPLLDGCHWLPTPENLWVEAGELGYLLRRRGVTPKMLDLLIATYALAHDVAMLTLDRDFRHMREAGIALTLVSWCVAGERRKAHVSIARVRIWRRYCRPWDERQPRIAPLNAIAIPDRAFATI